MASATMKHTDKKRLGLLISPELHRKLHDEAYNADLSISRFIEARLWEVFGTASDQRKSRSRPAAQ